LVLGRRAQSRATAAGRRRATSHHRRDNSRAAQRNERGRKLVYFRSNAFIFIPSAADVAELADALDSKSGTRKSVWVRPPPSAPIKSRANCACASTSTAPHSWPSNAKTKKGRSQ